MDAETGLRVDPDTVRRVARAVDAGAEDLRNRLTDLDRRVAAVLGGWRGASGSAWAAAWEQWHRGAGEVQAGLATLARALARAAGGYAQNENQSAAALREVVGGD